MLLTEWTSCLKRSLKPSWPLSRDDLLNLASMMIAHGGLSKEEMKRNMMLFFVAGHETTAAALAWHMYLLASHCDVQDKARREVDKVLQFKNVDFQSQKQLHYLDCVIKESMRLFPPASNITSRVAAEETVIDGYRIPKGTVVGVSMYTIHHDPEFWPDPEKFDPDRFVAENSEGRDPYSYLPFSMGFKNCIGSNFSLIEQRMFLASILQSFHIEGPCETHSGRLSVFSTLDKLVLTLWPRKHPFCLTSTL
eukprot:TRINITY_DN1173_c0_g1_i7.p2 TRINITY_DN1173_c0_g1~~TRINITY_DN1173_c0_g1_i7.p2  ORF type:complete len:251 (+),score=59.05 TRINITY_DN1173_c0_g1_i7:795-1547(+)